MYATASEPLRAVLKLARDVHGPVFIDTFAVVCQGTKDAVIERGDLCANEYGEPVALMATLGSLAWTLDHLPREAAA